MAILLGHNWPGNVRELENAIERAILATTGTVIGSDVLSFLTRTIPMQHEVPGWIPVVGPQSFPTPFQQPKTDSAARC